LMWKQKTVWDGFFNEAYVVEWAQFIKGLRVSYPSLDPKQEEQLRRIIDPSKTNSVSRVKFQEFVKAFGSMDKCVENAISVANAPWFFGFVSSNESKKFLETQSVGTFLIRFSGTVLGTFVLDYVNEQDHIRSVRLKGHPEGGFVAKVEGGKEKGFKTLHELVDTYQKLGVLITPFSSTLPEKPWFFGDLTREEASQLLTGQKYGTFIVRFSNQPGCFAVSFVDKEAQIAQGLITRSPSGGYQVSGKGVIFDNLDALVEHYMKEKIFTEPFLS